MELAAGLGPAQPGRLIMAAISAVFTIGYVANLLGEDENWIFDLSIDMFPEDGCLWVHGVGEDGVPAFTSPETASKTCARSSPMREMPTADRLLRRESKPPAVITVCLRGSGVPIGFKWGIRVRGFGWQKLAKSMLFAVTERGSPRECLTALRARRGPLLVDICGPACCSRFTRPRRRLHIFRGA
jgi:hypothetical protein